MLRFGKISAFDPETGLAKVSFEEDGIVTDWIPVLKKNTLKNKHAHVMDVGEHVACMMDENAENGVVMGAINSKNEAPGAVKGADIEGVAFEDGTTVEYNRSTNELKINCMGDVKVICQNAIVEASAKVTIDTPEAEVTGNLTVGGSIDATGNMSSSGSIEATGDITSTAGDVVATTISLQTHVHPGVQPGGGTTSTPI